MKKNIIIKTTLVFIMALFITACEEDFLEVENPNNLTEIQIQTPSGIRQLEVGMYRRLADAYNYFWQTYMSHLPGEYEMLETTGEGPAHKQIWDLNMSATNPFIGWLYSDYYAVVSNANRIITFIEQGTGTVSELPEREANLILGGAYFMRAFSHFYLLHSWGRPFDDDDQYGILMHTNILQEREDFSKARSKPSEVYAQIEQDLIKAESILILASELTSDELGRPTRGAATAYLGKMYVFQERYQEAADKFQQFIDENPDKGLLPYYGDNFHGEYENGMESVFEIQYADLTTTNRWGGGGTANHYQIYVGGHGMGRHNFSVPNPIVRREDDPNAIPGDIRNFDVRDIRFSETVYAAGPTRSYVFHGDTILVRDSLFFPGESPRRIRINPKSDYSPKKYINNRRRASNDSGLAEASSEENQVVMRVAEVYMLYAEALANLGRVSEAADWLNIVIRRARGYHLDEVTPYDFTGSDFNAFMELLMEEKRKEFIGEQIRWYDILRWGIVEQEIARNPRRAENVSWNIRSAAFPIPLRELSTNLEMGQNPGY